MVDPAKGYISQAIFYSAHALDNRMRYRQEEAESTFGSLFNGQSQQTNVQDDFDPSAPRLIFQNPHKQFLLSKNSSQLVLGFQDAEKSISAQMDIVVDNILRSLKKVADFSDCTGEVGFILNFSFPSAADRSALSEAVFNKFLKMPKLHEVASTSVKVGFQTAAGLFLNIESDVYELRRGQMEGAAINLQALDISKLELQEMGFSFKVDINNKPRLGSGVEYLSEAKGLISAMREFMQNQFGALVEFK